MNIRRILPVFVLLSMLACNYVMKAFHPVPSSDEMPARLVSTPAYIPADCKNQPFATIAPAITLAKPTPSLKTNPEISHNLQERVFSQVVRVVNEIYVYPDYNGHNWTQITINYQKKIDAGLSTQDFYSAMYSMITELGDDHSNFESPAEVALSEAELAGSDNYVGIGVYLLPVAKRDRAAVISVFPNSPAEYAGLKPHDSILAMDGIPLVQNGQERSGIILGAECSALVLSVQSVGGTPRDVMLVRQKIQGNRIIESSLLPTADGSRVGYISLPTFFDETIPGQVAEALKKFGVLDGLILDNRMNSGGSSDVVEPILSYFASGTLGIFASRTGSRPLTITPDPIQNSQTVPLVVLVGEDTISFGEIFSGVLKDAGRAKIVGQLTLGNVEVLRGHNLEDGSRLWLAEETFIPAHSQANWEQTGIVPDVVAYADWDTFTFDTDPSIAAALKLLGH
jgi:carboxyl-terminal processing protease